MKRSLLLTLCALFAGTADARTLYVDASRPNNNGNGLSPAKAKKTIQAAINIAKKGDTILVYPGTYAPIKTNNRQITVKSVSGTGNTTIKIQKAPKIKLKRRSGHYVWTWSSVVAAANLGKETQTTASVGGISFPAPARGNASKLTGFTLDGNKDIGYSYLWTEDSGPVSKCETLVLKNGATKVKKVLSYSSVGVAGGTVSSCILTNFGNVPLAINSKVVSSRIIGNYAENGKDVFYTKSGSVTMWSGNFYFAAFRGIESSTFSRCVFEDNNFRKKTPSNLVEKGAFNVAYPGGINNSTFVNCQFSENTYLPFDSCTFVNCTLANNSGVSLSKTKANNSILANVGASQFKKARKNTVKNCYRGTNPGFMDGSRTRVWVIATEDDYDEDETVREVWSDGGYKYGYYESVAGGGNYRLATGSPCIDKGKLTKAQKKLVGKKDLAGRKRIRGKSVDIGCYEY